MAIIYQAELSPSKPEILHQFLESRSWGETGELEVLGAYRFDDPDGEVGIECHFARVGETVYHLPLAYRAEPVEGAAEGFIGTMDHSVLGERYVYDGLADDVALDCFRRAICGEQQQAALEIYTPDGEQVETRPQSVTLSLEVDEGEEPPSADELLDGEPFTIARTVGGLDGTVRLVATWADGNGVIAAY
ncbi:MAG: maltokinase N-terminal cap-like domain-containing protein [Brachybacterium tyrofermentans]